MFRSQMEKLDEKELGFHRKRRSSNVRENVTQLSQRLGTHPLG